jgi:hypothetical protein
MIQIMSDAFSKRWLDLVFVAKVRGDMGVSYGLEGLQNKRRSLSLM